MSAAVALAMRATAGDREDCKLLIEVSVMQVKLDDLFGLERSVPLASAVGGGKKKKRLSYVVIIGHEANNAYVVEHGDRVEQFGSLESAIRRYNEV